MIAVVDSTDEAVLAEYHGKQEAYTPDIALQQPRLTVSEVADEIRESLLTAVMVGSPA